MKLEERTFETINVMPVGGKAGHGVGIRLSLLALGYGI